MDWIKQKYDRLLLGVFGVGAVATACLKITSSPAIAEMTTGKPKDVKLDAPPAASADQATKLLGERVEIKEPRIDEYKSAKLFSASPQIKTADGTIHEVRSSATLRAPIPNFWIDDNGLDITRDDIATVDTDGDGFTNAEEYEAKTNPRSSSSAPDMASKLYVKEFKVNECTLKLTTYDEKSGEIGIRQDLPVRASTFDAKVGGTFPDPTKYPDAKFSWKITKAEKRPVQNETEPKAFVTLVENKDGAQPVELQEGVVKELPSFEVILEFRLGPGEETKPLKEGETFELAKIPGVKFTIKKVDAEAQMVEIEYTPVGETKSKVRTATK